MKALTIFYSLDGNTKFIVNVINKELQGDILELKLKKEIPNKGFKKYLLAGKQVLFNEKPEIQEMNIDFTKYDLIVFGTPVWAGNFVPVFNTFFEKYEIKNKKVAFFCCHGGGGQGKVFTKFKENLKDNIFIGETLFQDPLKKDKENNALSAKRWINEIKKI